MEENQIQQQPKTNMPQVNCPGAIASLILGILSLLSGCLMVGLILGIVGAVIAGNGNKAYMANPSRYKGMGMLKAGRITSILGIIFGAIALVGAIISAVIVGGDFLWMLDLLGL